MTENQKAVFKDLLHRAEIYFDLSEHENFTAIENARKALIEDVIVDKKPTVKKAKTKKAFDRMKFASDIAKSLDCFHKTFKIENGTVMSTDIDRYFTFKTEQEDGVYTFKNKILLKYQNEVMQFPDWPDVEEAIVSFEVDAEVQKKITLASSVDPLRTTLCGVCFNCKDGVFNVVATDGRRCHVYERPMQDSKDWEITIPTNIVNDLLTLNEETVKVSVHKKYIITEGDGWKYIAKIIDCAYPNFRQVIPQESNKIELDYDSFVEGLEQKILPMGKALREKKTEIKCRLDIFQDKMDIKLVEQGGEASFSIPIHSQIATKVYFNVKYLIDLLKCCGREASLSLKDEHSPLLVKSDSFHAVLMPCRMN